MLTGDDRAALLVAMEEDFSAALSVLKRRTGGDYGADHRRAKFPASIQPSTVPTSASVVGLTVWEAFEGWVMERQPAVSTVNRWRGVFENLDKYHKGRDIALFTDADAVEWKNALVGEGRGTRTLPSVHGPEMLL